MPDKPTESDAEIIEIIATILWRTYNREHGEAKISDFIGESTELVFALRERYAIVPLAEYRVMKEAFETIATMIAVNQVAAADAAKGKP